jgi:hypothetical protein
VNTIGYVLTADDTHVDELRLLEAEAVHIMVDAPYEPPANADLVLDTAGADIDELVKQGLEVLKAKQA